MALQEFPHEVLVEIFSNLHLRDLFACDGTCRVFHQLLTNSSYLKYRIELEKAGMIDNPYCQLPTPTKVEMLREREHAWSTFDWMFIKTKKVPSTASPAYGLSADELSLGIEGGAEEFVTTGIQYLKLPSTVGGEVTPTSWRQLDFGETFLDFGSAAEEYDLLFRSKM
jgi:F-box-like